MLEQVCTENCNLGDLGLEQCQVGQEFEVGSDGFRG